MARGRGPLRRAGVRGILAAAATSTVAHALAKPLLPRSRPWSRRFPSAHAASSTAFVTGAAMESPLLGAALAPLAVGVSSARVSLGERTFADVAAGAVLGAGIATLTRRWWPVVRHAPARARPAGGAPALGDGAGLVIVANRSAGTPGPLETLGQIVAPVVGVGGDEDEEDPVAEVHAEIHAVLPKAQVVIPTPGEDFVVEVEAALDRPMVDGSATRAIGVAGGDGSVAALAGLAQRRHVPAGRPARGHAQPLRPRRRHRRLALGAGRRPRRRRGARRRRARRHHPRRGRGAHRSRSSTPRASAATPTWSSCARTGRSSGASGRRRPWPWCGCSPRRPRWSSSSTAAGRASGSSSSATAATSRAAWPRCPARVSTRGCSTSATCAPTCRSPAPGS